LASAISRKYFTRKNNFFNYYDQLELKLKFSRLKKQFTGRIHPVQAIMFFAGLLAFVLGVIARFVVNERILKMLLVLLATISVLALLFMAGIVLTYVYQIISGAIRRNFRRRDEYRVFRDSPADIRQLCKPSGRNLEFASSDEIEARGSSKAARSH
jgi:hypothetical protein